MLSEAGLRKLIRKLNEVLDEINSTASAGEIGFLTPKAFGKNSKKYSEVLGMKEIPGKQDDEDETTVKEEEDVALPIQMRKLVKPINEAKTAEDFDAKILNKYDSKSDALLFQWVKTGQLSLREFRIIINKIITRCSR